MANNLYAIWFSTVTSVSLKAKQSVLSYFGSPEAAFRSAPGTFYRVPGLSRTAAEVFETRDMARVAEVLIACTEQHIEIITLEDPRFPERLRNVFSPPAALYVRGKLPEIDSIPVIAVIGTRKATPYGINMGKKLAYQISRCGGVVMSGLTAGIDSAAAEGALIAQNPCICVLGTAHEKEHGRLASEVLSLGGAVISEYPPGTAQDRGFFRARNRIAAGISIAVVVVEAPEKSGTRLFVNDAVEQGKDVFAVPGSADNPLSAGTIALIKDGATAVTEGWEVMSEYMLDYPTLISEDRTPFVPAALLKTERRQASGKAVDPVPAVTVRKAGVELSPEQRIIVDAVRSGSATVDSVIATTGLPASKVLSQLTVLEIKGLIRREAGKQLRLNIQ